MELKLVRKIFTNNSTIGELFVDGAFECYTLEDKVRDVKIMHETAIPYGRYEVILAFSPRFGRILPRLRNVPNYEGVLVHSGNSKDDSSGCILVGQTKAIDWIGKSRDALKALQPKIEAALKTEKVFIEITKE